MRKVTRRISSDLYIRDDCSHGTPLVARYWSKSTDRNASGWRLLRRP